MNNDVLLHDSLHFVLQSCFDLCGLGVDDLLKLFDLCLQRLVLVREILIFDLGFDEFRSDLNMLHIRLLSAMLQ